MSSSDKIVYAPRDENGHANSRKVRSTWPKVIVTESYLTLAFDSSRSLRPRATNLTLARHSPVFISRRVKYYFFLFLQRLSSLFFLLLVYHLAFPHFFTAQKVTCICVMKNIVCSKRSKLDIRLV